MICGLLFCTQIIRCFGFGRFFLLRQMRRSCLLRVQNVSPSLSRLAFRCKTQMFRCFVVVFLFVFLGCLFWVFCDIFWCPIDFVVFLCFMGLVVDICCVCVDVFLVYDLKYMISLCVCVGVCLCVCVVVFPFVVLLMFAQVPSVHANDLCCLPSTFQN